MVFNGSTNAFSNTTTVIPVVPAQAGYLNDYSIFTVYSNTVAPAANAYMNAVYGSNGFPMLGVFGVTQQVSTRSVVANTGGFRRLDGWIACNAFGGSSFEGNMARGIATDASGNVFTIGMYNDNSSVSFFTANGLTGGVSAGSLPFAVGDANFTEVYIAKYTPVGQVEWFTRITSRSATRGNAIAVDPSGNVLVTGSFACNAVTLYNGPDGSLASSASLPWVSGQPGYVAKYSTSGQVIWAAHIQTSVAMWSIASDASGNVIAGGGSSGALSFCNAGGTTAVATLATTFDAFIVKYTSAGVVSWAARMVSTGVDEVTSIATDTSGNIFVAGTFSNAMTLYSTGGTPTKTLPYVGGSDIFVAKYSPTGTITWALRIAGTTTSADNRSSLKIDSSGNIVLLGYTDAGMTLYNSDGNTGATYPTYGIFIARYSTNGFLTSSVQFTSQIPLALGLDPSNNAIIYYGSPRIVRKYSPSGTLLWSASYTGTTNQGTLATDSSGNVFVGPHFGGGTALVFTNADATNVTSLPGPDSRNYALVKYTTDGYVTVPYKANSNILVGVSFLFSTNVMSTFINGDPPTVASVQNPTLATTGMNIGGPSNYFNGTISEVLIFSGNLTAGQRQIVEGYLAYKWGIQTNLPTIQPFYRSIPFARYFSPVDILNCSVWMDGGDNSTMNSTTSVTTWNDKSGNSNTMTGSGTWSGSNMVFNGSTNAFSNTGYVFPNTAYSLFAVYSNTVAPAAAAYMNVMYGANGFPMLGTYDVNKFVTARSVVANTGGLSPTVPVGWASVIGSTNDDRGYGVATDTSGNVFVTGNYTAATAGVYNEPGTVIGVTLSNAGLADAFIAKYSSVGKVLWAARIASTGADIGNGVATDTSGNVFVTGQYGAALTLYSTGETSSKTLPYVGGTDCFLAKYLSNGTIDWAAQIAGTTTSADIGYGVATDTSGNVFVIGAYVNALTLYNSTGVSNASLLSSGNSSFIAKYSSIGNVLWATRIASTNPGYRMFIRIDTSGNVIVAGAFGGTASLYSQPGTVVARTLAQTGGVSDTFVAKYSSDGNIVWAAKIGGGGADYGGGLATDNLDNVLVTGRYAQGVTLFSQPGTVSALTLSGQAGGDSYIAKYSSAGNIVWGTRVSCVTGTNNGATGDGGIASDGLGNVFVSGTYNSGVSLYNQPGTTVVGATLTLAGSSSSYVAKYSSTGNVLWATRMVNTGFVNPQSIVADVSGNSTIVGFASPLTAYNTPGTVAVVTVPLIGSYDIFIVKYNPDGFIKTTLAADSNVLVDATYASSIMSPFANGTAATTLAGSTVATTGLYLGGPSNYFNGTLSELIIYSATLSTSQREKVEGYLLNKWGLKSQMIATQPYLTRFPSASSSFLPTSVPGCVLWLDTGDSNQFIFSSGSNISRWYDKSGQSNFMVSQGTPPTYSNGGVYMGGSGYMIRNAAFTPSNFFCVFKQVSSGGPLFSTSAIASGQTGFFPNENGSYYLTTGDASWATGVSPLASNTIQMVATRHVQNTVGCNVSAFFNGSNSLSTTQAATISYSFLRLGNRFNGTVNTYFTGFFYEVIVYSGVMTAANRESVEGYLARKWGTTTLPTTHSRYNVGPAVS